jgi:hypothetical protein
MRSSSLLVALGICAGAAPEQSTDDVLALLTSLNQQAIDMLGGDDVEKRAPGSCSIFNARIRKDW